MEKMIVLILFSFVFMVLIGVNVNAIPITLTAGDAPTRFSNLRITTSNNSYEKYFNTSIERLDTNKWRLYVEVRQDLLDDLRKCFNNLTGTETYPFYINMFYCNVTELNKEYFPGYVIPENTVKAFINGSRQAPITLNSGSGFASLNVTDYLSGSFYVDLTFGKLGSSFKMGYGTIYTFLDSSVGNSAVESAFDEVGTVIQDSGSAINVCNAACLNNTNTSNDDYFVTTQGDAGDEAYFAVNWTISGAVNSVLASMEGHQEDTGVSLIISYWNWSTSTWIKGTTVAVTQNVDTTMKINLTGANLTRALSSAGVIRTVISTSDTAANVLEIDYVSLLVDYNSSVTGVVGTTNDTDVFIGESVQHNATFTTGVGSTLSAYIFYYNTSGIGCNEWANSTGLLSGTTQTINVNITIGSNCSGKVMSWYFKGNNSDKVINTTAVMSHNISSYGTLNVTITSPVDSYNVTQGNTFQINATIQCMGSAGARCGDVNAYARYNGSSINPDTNVNATSNLSISPISNLTPIIVLSYLHDILLDEFGVDYNAKSSTNSLFGDGTNNLARASVIQFKPTFTGNLTNFTFFTTQVNGFDYLDSINVSVCTLSAGDLCEFSNCSVVSNWNPVWAIGAQTITFTSNYPVEINKNYTLFFNNTQTNNDGIQDGIYVSGNTTNNINMSSFIITTCIAGRRNFILNATIGYSTFVYNNQSNPLKTSSFLQGQTFNVSWTVNATGANATYLVDVLANSSFGSTLVKDNNSEDRKVCIGECGAGVADIIKPAISNVKNSTVTNQTALITWTTNENSNSTVKYGWGTSYTINTTISNVSSVTAHQVNLTSLFNNTIYYYNVTSCDTSGNCNTSDITYNFTTLQTASGDSCDTNNWVCSENCEVTGLNAGGNTIFATGAGTIRVTSDVTNCHYGDELLVISGGCEVKLTNANLC